uniref:Exodeoxyribonuclease X-like C-terminal domain-containing protein n=1 Tax=Noctiluca scintillans TaxID=2966 RepID=A7WQB2_NOCSC|nr:unknown [Noctiluca scintillans]
MIVAAKIAQRVSGRRAGTTAATRWLPISRSFVSSSEVVDFGKHRGLTFEEILQKDKQYCQWAVSTEGNEQTSPTMSKLITFLKEAGVQHETLHETITFGKYSGKSYGEVFTNDSTYCEWVLHNSKDDTPSGSFADWIRARHPQFVSKVGRS